MRRRPRVTGKTLIIPMIGHPVEQVQTPGPMNHWFADQNIDAVIVPMDIRPERVANFFDVLKATENCVGCSITMPHKQAAFTASDEVSERARRAKSVNIIRRLPSGRLVGDMTDGIAMVAALEKNGIGMRGCNVLLIGAGAAGTAIAFEVAEKGARSLVVLERDQMRGRALITELSLLYPDLSVFDKVPKPGKVDIAINASPAGMDPSDPLPYPLEQLADVQMVADAVTRPAVTSWLTEAGKRGFKTQTGEEMALAQVSIQLQYLRFQSVPAQSDATQTPSASHGGVK